MSQRFTVYLTPETLAMLRPGESLSGRINDIFERYAVLRQHLPDVITDIDNIGRYRGFTWAELDACRKAIED